MGVVMRLVRKSFIFIIIFIVFINFICFSESLTYDISSGSLTDISMSAHDRPNTPGSFANATEVWNSHSFLGRLIYTGPPTILSFMNTGPLAQNTQNNRFYFTYIDNNGQSDTNRWREFFLVLRPKGIYHGQDVHHDFSLINTVVEHPGQTVNIAYGAGSEEVEIGETGYNERGNQGTYNGSNGYKYKYPYRHIWIDVTLIRTEKHRLRSRAYESEITVSTLSGINLVLRLSGRYLLTPNDPPPTYAFGVFRTIENNFPFYWLEGRHTVQEALTIGQCFYNSEESAAIIRFASNQAGTSDIFFFQNESGRFFRYYLAFEATTPSRPAVPITLDSEFLTHKQMVFSPIDSSTNEMHVLIGNIKMYLPTSTYPSSGTYSTTIYCFITTSDF